jgi:polar amino acid transport system substrate-binding protein
MGMSQTARQCTRWLATTLALCVGGVALAAENRPVMTFSCAIVPDSAVIEQLDLLYQQAFAQLGYNFVMLNRPSRRSLTDVNQGHVDGECARFGLLQDDTRFTELVRVEAKLVNFNLNVYSYRTDLPEITSANFSQLALRVGYQRGSAAQDVFLAELPDAYRTQFIELGHGLRMMAAGRLDVIVSAQAMLTATLAKVSTPAPQRVGTLARYGAYPYLNREHQLLAPRLARELNKILSDPEHPLHRFSE